MLIQIQIDTAEKLKNLKSFKDRVKTYDDVINVLIENNKLYLEDVKKQKKLTEV